MKRPDKIPIEDLGGFGAWWIPDGQLCPTVPNRSNYIHWIEDLLSSDIIPNSNGDKNSIKGLDIGTGANCIYPLLGASLLGWSFVGTDVTDVALEWAERNVKNNPQISELIEIRKVDYEKQMIDQDTNDDESYTNISRNTEQTCDENKSYHGAPILAGVVKSGETFDFCMCNPPFFESMEESGLNPNTSCGGTPAEMVCPGGEQAFISRMIQDSVQLKQSFRWYTSMVGKKSSLKSLTSKLREVGVSVVKTTEFVQGQTCRWGIAWSFVPPTKKIISSHVASKNVLTFMLEGIQRQFSAFHVLQSVESFFTASGAACKSNAASFHVDVFEQIPGTLLVRGSLKPGENVVPGYHRS
ncbi:methyltransferase-like protein 16 isoform X1 [Tanacetum coccineum]